MTFLLYCSSVVASISDSVFLVGLFFIAWFARNFRIKIAVPDVRSLFIDDFCFLSSYLRESSCSLSFSSFWLIPAVSVTFLPSAKFTRFYVAFFCFWTWDCTREAPLPRFDCFNNLLSRLRFGLISLYVGKCKTFCYYYCSSLLEMIGGLDKVPSINDDDFCKIWGLD